jgi:hypothetical protein
MRHGLAAAGGALAAGGVVEILEPVSPAAAAPAQLEARALTQALQIEQVVVIAYRQVTSSNVVKPAVRAQLRMLLDQETEHVTLLKRALSARGEIVPAPPNLDAAQAVLSAHKVHWSLTQLRNQHDALKLLVDLESLAENVYFDAVGIVAETALVRTCAEIMGCEAQHWTVLSGLLNHEDATKAVPYPFVAGSA